MLIKSVEGWGSQAPGLIACSWLGTGCVRLKVQRRLILSLSVSLTGTSSLFPTWPGFSQPSHPYNTYSQWRWNGFNSMLLLCVWRKEDLSCFSLFLKTLKGVCLCPAACLLGCCRKRRTMNGFLHQGIGLLKTLNAIVFSPGGGERKHLHWRAGKKLVRL